MKMFVFDLTKNCLFRLYSVPEPALLQNFWLLENAPVYEADILGFFYEFYILGFKNVHIPLNRVEFFS
jgi:hypothetical protein